MVITDTHTHLYATEFAAYIDEVIERAKAAGVTRCFLPNVDLATADALVALAKRYPDMCFPMMGLHPCHVKENFEEELATLFAYFDRETFCAVGEIGIDLYWDKTTLDIQTIAFKKQVEFAIERKLPICIHSRESFDIIADILEDYKGKGLTGVFHCFTGNLEQAERAIGFGFMLGIGGVLTFKNSGLDVVVKEVDLKHLVLETDSPYLAPVPHRGKRNESAYTALVAQKLADIKEMPLAELARITTENSVKLFSL
jgi:TatD DNase family protein